VGVTKPLLCLSRAQITRDSNGSITIDDPESPIIVIVTIAGGQRPPQQISELVVRARHSSARITPAALGRLPLAQIKSIAARSDAHPNDMIWRTKVSPKPEGARHWDEDHWQQVLNVYEWARETKRPGGGARAVADMWNVARNPTAYRWLARARSLLSR